MMPVMDGFELVNLNSPKDVPIMLTKESVESKDKSLVFFIGADDQTSTI